jgi:hypothetical protein
MIATDKLSLFFSNEFPFNKEGLEEFVHTFVIKSYKKGEIILKNGNIENELRFFRPRCHSGILCKQRQRKKY